ncbi:cell division protein FtsQ/DivIB [Ferrimonas lipolytica]|uniref:Cell division protein FtsQ n=1 Tax=Ferrimonas lipolytica TaxID=2724191 RepID=A0A6H1UHE8_9GAMM|nr:cell division protein FtsQ/DivIB [Ferrimonas lipolytica]QIZ78535.1 FtsQ-type POTRA domain-containing protein [Ferrimonas lipolytica]
MAVAWREVRWEMWLGIGFLLFTLTGLSRLGYWLFELGNDADQVPIEELALLGERRFTSDTDVQQAVKQFSSYSLFSADVAAVSDTLSALPWVDRALVRREWPNRMRVFVLEQNPVAQWGDYGWLNDRAESFSAPKRQELNSLPLLRGPQASEQKVWQMWQQLSELLVLNGHQGQSLVLSTRHAWTLVLNNGLELVLGRNNTVQRVQRFIDVWPRLQQTERAVARVDLRYDTGLAVQWQGLEQ